MARSNVLSPRPVTHQGGPAEPRQTPIQTLRRAVLTALLWEQSFYETGQAQAERVAALVPLCRPEDVAALAIEARETMYLRHVPLYLVRLLAKTPGNGTIVAATLARVIQRADELGEYLAIYWAGQTEHEPLSAGSKRGLALAIRKFGAYQLAKYDRDNAAVKLRDVLRLVHANPDQVGDGVWKSFVWTGPTLNPTTQTHRVYRHLEGTGALWGEVVARTLAAPDTWEVALSGGADKRATFERLLREEKLGALAFLRNLRNMTEAQVDETLIRARFAGNLDKVLPFRYLAAARHAPSFADEINTAMLRAVADEPKLPGRTAVLVDISGSMDADLAGKSEMKRIDAAAGAAVLIREVAETCRVFAFSDRLAEVPNLRGLALVDGVLKAMPHSGTFLGHALREVQTLGTFDRIVVLTDEQAADAVTQPTGGARGYVINVAGYAHGVDYQAWTHIDGFSERVLDFLRAAEAATAAA